VAFARRSTFRRTPQSLRRKTAWDIGPEGAPANLSTETTALFPVAAQVVEDAVTLVRTRGACLLQYVSAGSAGDYFRGAVAIGICSAEAFTAGAASLPSPWTDADREDWLWHSYFQLRSWGGAATFGDAGGPSQRFDVDSRAMRKLNIGDVIYGVLETGVESGAVVMSALLDTRCLFKLP